MICLLFFFQPLQVSKQEKYTAVVAAQCDKLIKHDAYRQKQRSDEDPYSNSNFLQLLKQVPLLLYDIVLIYF